MAAVRVAGGWPWRPVPLPWALRSPRVTIIDREGGRCFDPLLVERGRRPRGDELTLAFCHRLRRCRGRVLGARRAATSAMLPVRLRKTRATHHTCVSRMRSALVRPTAGAVGLCSTEEYFASLQQSFTHTSCVDQTESLQLAFKRGLNLPVAAGRRHCWQSLRGVRQMCSAVARSQMPMLQPTTCSPRVPTWLITPADGCPQTLTAQAGARTRHLIAQAATPPHSIRIGQ